MCSWAAWPAAAGTRYSAACSGPGSPAQSRTAATSRQLQPPAEHPRSCAYVHQRPPHPAAPLLPASQPAIEAADSPPPNTLLPQSGFINSFPFDPAGMNSPAMQTKEVKNGRLAMVGRSAAQRRAGGASGRAPPRPAAAAGPLAQERRRPARQAAGAAAARRAGAVACPRPPPTPARPCAGRLRRLRGAGAGQPDRPH
jgi:hypothetical protein